MTVSCEFTALENSVKLPSFAAKYDNTQLLTISLQRRFFLKMLKSTEAMMLLCDSLQLLWRFICVHRLIDNTKQNGLVVTVTTTVELS